jgi:SPP1 family phage portal protein
MSGIAEINLLYQKLKSDSKVTTEAMIKSLINLYLKSDDRKNKIDGINYYDSENTEIKNRKEKDLISNTRNANGFYKKLVDQKVNYCVGNEVVVENLNDDEIIDINDFLIDICEGASIKGIEWLYLYMDKPKEKNKSGELNYKIIDSSECIPIWDTEFEDELKTMIRFYQIEQVDNEKTFWSNRVEVYDNEKVTYYQEDKNNNYNIDVEIPNPVYYNSHQYITMGNVTGIKNFGWGKVPFVPLFNTRKAVYDLQNVKSDIDLYDETKSDFANNLALNMEAIMIIVNRGQQDLAEIKKKIEEFRIIEVDDISEIGGVKYLVLDIPVEARKTFLEIIRKDIYSNGFGVDVKDMEGREITNVYIKSLYSDLDLKANKFIRQIKKFLKQFYEFVNIYRKAVGEAQIDVNNLNYIFNKKMIFNESEMIDNFTKQGGEISKKTLLSNHPQVDDVDEELKEIEKDKVQYDDNINDNANDLQLGDEE